MLKWGIPLDREKTGQDGHSYTLTGHGGFLLVNLLRPAESRKARAANMLDRRITKRAMSESLPLAFPQADVPRGFRKIASFVVDRSAAFSSVKKRPEPSLNIAAAVTLCNYVHA